MIRCPVCSNESTSLLCPECGFDSSCDYEAFPTLGTVLAKTAAHSAQTSQQTMELSPFPRP